MKMVKCEKCGGEFDHLINYQTGVQGWKFYKGVKARSEVEDYIYSLDDTEFIHDDGENYWACPICGKRLASCEEDAIDILEER